MNIHEYQSKEILKRFGCPVSKGFPVTTESEAKKVVKELAGPVYVVKAQIHAGGRGKGRFKGAPASAQGGVRLAKSKDEAIRFVGEMLGETLVTEQTGPEGKRVNRVYIEEAASIKREYYLSLLIDRSRSCVAFVVSTEGGTSIEDVAHATPEKIATIPIDPVTGVMPHHARSIANALKIDHVLDAALFAEVQAIVPRLYAVFIKMDMTLLEINPLIVTDDDRLTCLDAKVSFDSNAFFRHPELPELRDPEEEDPREIEASAHGLSYIALSGSIGCMVNGAGLAMATMDIIKLYGESPANFLDVGGGASQEQVSAAFKIITSDESVKGILINIFGGIMRCDVIAKGVVSAVKEVSLKVPLVVRLEGTNADEGKEILEKSGLNILSAGDLDEAAQKIVKAVKG